MEVISCTIRPLYNEGKPAVGYDTGRALESERVGKDNSVLCCMFSFREYPKENIQQSGYGAMVEWPLLGKNRKIGHKPAPLSIFPPWTSYEVIPGLNPKENIQQSGYGAMVEWPLLGKNWGKSDTNLLHYPFSYHELHTKSSRDWTQKKTYNKVVTEQWWSGHYVGKTEENRTQTCSTITFPTMNFIRSHPGTEPKRKHTTYRTRRKSEIKNSVFTGSWTLIQWSSIL